MRPARRWAAGLLPACLLWLCLPLATHADCSPPEAVDCGGASIYYVCHDGSSCPTPHYSGIQAAVTAAVTHYGNACVVICDNETYTDGPVSIPKESLDHLVIVGSPAPNQPTIAPTGSGDAVFIIDMNKVTLENLIIQAENYTDGIKVNSINNSISSNMISSATNADIEVNSSYNTISYNMILGAKHDGIEVNSNNNSISYNTIMGAINNGIQIYGSDWGGGLSNFIDSNIITDAEENGIDISYNTNSTISNNIITNAGGVGISITQGEENSTTINNNTISSSGDGIVLSGNGGNTLQSNTITSLSGDGIDLMDGGGDTVAFSSITATVNGIHVNAPNDTFYYDTITEARYGLAVDALASGLSISNLTFQNLQPGATAISFANYSGPAFVSTYANVNFTMSSGVNIDASELASGTNIYMLDAAGYTGEGNADDPYAYVHWLDCSCGNPCYVRPGGTYPTITSAVNTIPASYTGNQCIYVDTSTYYEQVVVEGKTPSDGVSGITIALDPAIYALNQATATVVDPPNGEEAAFHINNASVTLANIHIIPTKRLTYGVHVYSPYVVISSVSILDSGGNITNAGIYWDFSSGYNMVSYSTITVGGTFSNGIDDNSSGGNLVSRSYIFAPNYGINVENGGGNTISNNTISSSNDGIVLYDAGGDTVTFSSITALSTGIYVNSPDVTLSSNVVTGAKWGIAIDTYALGLAISSLTFQNLQSGATAINFTNETSGKTFLSTFTSVAFNKTSGVNINASPLDPSSTIWMFASAGPEGGTTNGPAFADDPNKVVHWGGLPPPGCDRAINVAQDGSGDYTHIQDGVSYAVDHLLGNTCVVITDGKTYNESVLVLGSPSSTERLTIMGYPNAPTISGGPVFRIEMSSVTLRNLIIASAGDYGVLYESGNFNNISGSTITAGYVAVEYDSGADNTITGSYLFGGYYGVLLYGDGNDTISSNTISSSGVGIDLYDAGGDVVVANTINADGNGINAEDGSGGNNAISGNTITGSGEAGLYLQPGSGGGNWISDNTISSPYGIVLYDAGGDTVALCNIAADPCGVWCGSPNLTLSSNVVTGAKWGLAIDAGAAPGLAISSLTFQNLQSGATAINFTNVTTFLSTFTSVAFNETGGVNINASLLNPSSTIWMITPTGMTGHGFSNDPSYVVHWLVPPACVCGINPCYVRPGGTYPTITSAVNAVPASFTSNECIYVDTSTYSEQVTVANKTSSNNALLIIELDPAIYNAQHGSTATVVNPPAGSNAAFQIMNASVTIANINIISTNSVHYGVLVSSSYATISSVTINDPSPGHIQDAGVCFGFPGGSGMVAYSTITAGSAEGIIDYGYGGSTITYSVINAASVGLSIGGSQGDSISFSTITTQGTGHGIEDYAGGSAISHSVINANGVGLYIGGSQGDSISFSTITVQGDGEGVVDYVGGSTITASVINFQGVGNGVDYYGAGGDIISGSIITCQNGDGVDYEGGGGNTITASVISAWDDGVYDGSGGGNLISASTITSTNGSGGNGVNYENVGGSTITASIISAGGNDGVYDRSSGGNLISASTITSTADSDDNNGVEYVGGGGSNITASVITSLNGSGVAYAGGGSNNITASVISAATGVSDYSSSGSGNLISASVISAWSNGVVYGNYGGSTITASVISSGVDGVYDYSSGGNVISASSITAVTDGIYVDAPNVTLSSDFITDARIGLGIDAGGKGLAISGITFQDLLQGATAINFDMAGVYLATFTSVAFNETSGTNINASALAASSTIWMFASVGTSSGSAHATDPHQVVHWVIGGEPAGCACNGSPCYVRPGGAYLTITSALNAIPASYIGNQCIYVDTSAYGETVTVNQSPGDINSRIFIQLDPIIYAADPATATVINPPMGSTAAFQIMNAGVTIANINIIPTNSMSYGVYASSPNIAITSVNVIDPGGYITTAGVYFDSQSDYNTVSCSSVTVGNTGASGFYLNGSSMTTVSYSSVLANYSNGSANGSALYLNGASSNTFTALLANDPATPNGYGVKFAPGSNYNSISQSTMAGQTSGLVLYGEFNSVNWSYMYGSQASGMDIEYGNDNTINHSTMTSAGGYGGLYLNYAADNLVSWSYMYGSGGTHGAFIRNSSNYNSIIQSTMTGTIGLVLGQAVGPECSSNTVSGSYIFGTSIGAEIQPTSNLNTISQSTMIGGGSYGLWIYQSSSNTAAGCYIQGSPAVLIQYSTETAINYSTLVGANGIGLDMADGSVGLTLSSSSVQGSAGNEGVYLEAYNSGIINLSSNTITGPATGAYYGLLIATQGVAGSPFTGLSITSITFNSLPQGATAINFLGGQFLSTFTSVAFNETSGANINASPLAPSSTIWLFAPAGNLNGATYIDDPSQVVHWPSPGNPSIYAVYTTSITLSYGASGTQGYEVDASTRSDFQAGTVISSQTVNPNLLALTPQNLAVNTTYYLRTGALSGQTTYYNPTVLSTSTLATPPALTAVSTFTGVSASSITFNWSANDNPNPGTLYTVQTSTVANFANGVVITSNTYNVTLTTSGLNANTTYYFQVAAFNNNGVAGGYTMAIGTSTLAAAPALAATPFTAVGTAAITFSWTSSGAGMLYTVQTSTMANFASGVVITSNTYNTSLSSSGLNADTTYYFQVAAFNNNGVASGYTTAIGTSTLAAAPALTATPFTTVGTAAITFSWTSSGAGMLYTVQTSTVANFASGVMTTSNTYNVTLTTSGLNGNTTYYFQVAAINHNGVASGYTTAIGTSTLAATPALAATPFTAVGTSAITFSWTSSGAGTLYTGQTSTVATFTSGVVTSSNTYNVTLTTSGLNGNTTYYFQVAAINHNGVASGYTTTIGTSTLAAAPALAATPFTTVRASSITFNWTSSGADTLYTVQSSTVANFASGVVITSNTYNTSLSSSGLNANTTYYFHVAAFNNNGVAGGYTTAIGTSTLAAAPALAATPFTAVSTSAITFGWTSSGAGTLYAVQTSTVANFASGVMTTSNTYNMALTTSGLNADTTYYFQVAAFNSNGVASGYSTAIGTSTLAAAPALAATPFTAVGASSITFSWTSSGAGTLYAVQTSTVANFASGVMTTSNTYNVALTTSGLNANTTYYFQVAAVNNNGVASGYTTAIGTSTLAAAPALAATPFTAVGTSAITFSWTSSGAGTLYTVQSSTVATFTSGVVTSSNTYNTSLSTAGLNANTTYYFQVAAFNNDGVPSPYTAVQIGTSTLANAPTLTAASTFTMVTFNSITFNWSANNNPAGTLYAVQSATADPAAANGAIIVTSNTCHTLLSSPSLNANTTYYFRVQAVNSNSQATNYTATVAAETLQIAPGPPVLSAVVVASTTIRWAWTESGGAAASFGFYYSTGNLRATLPAGTSFYWEANLSTSTPYSRYVVSQNSGGQAQSSTDTVVTPALQSFFTGTTTATLTGTDGASVQIPTVLLGNTTAWLLSETPVQNPLTNNTVVLISSAQASLQAGLYASPASLTEFILAINHVRSTATFDSPVTVYVPYLDANNDGIVDGTNPPVAASTLQLYVLNENTAAWELIRNSTVDLVHHLVTAQMNHLSIFTALGTPSSLAAADLSGVLVYPIPYRPNGPDPNRGHPYAASDPKSGIIFDNLPNRVTIEIYAITGRRVARLDTSASSGKVQWNVQNDSGQDVGSGGYVAMISSPGCGKITRKLIIVR